MLGKYDVPTMLYLMVVIEIGKVMVIGSLRARLLLALALVCVACLDTTSAEETFVANLDASQVVGSSSETGTAVATFVLD